MWRNANIIRGIYKQKNIGRRDIERDSEWNKTEK